MKKKRKNKGNKENKVETRSMAIQEPNLPRLLSRNSAIRAGLTRHPELMQIVRDPRMASKLEDPRIERRLMRTIEEMDRRHQKLATRAAEARLTRPPTAARPVRKAGEKKGFLSGLLPFLGDSSKLKKLNIGDMRGHLTGANTFLQSIHSVLSTAEQAKKTMAAYRAAKEFLPEFTQVEPQAIEAFDDSETKSKD